MQGSIIKSESLCPIIAIHIPPHLGHVSLPPSAPRIEVVLTTSVGRSAMEVSL